MKELDPLGARPGSVAISAVAGLLVVIALAGVIRLALHHQVEETLNEARVEWLAVPDADIPSLVGVLGAVG